MIFIILTISILFVFSFVFGIQGNEMIIAGLFFLVCLSFINKLFIKSKNFLKGEKYD